MDQIYSLKTQVSDMLLKLLLFETCKKQRIWAPLQLQYPGVPCFLFTRHMAHSLTSVFAQFGFLGVSTGCTSSQMFIFVINIARGLSNASQPLFN